MTEDGGMMSGMQKNAGASIAVLLAMVAGIVFAEPPHAFRSRLVTVHRVDRRDMAVRPEADEYAFRDGVQVVVPDGAPALVRHAAEDFADYLIVSMRVNASGL